ncbi:tRNA pseudouridine(55) synthase TruB [Clostridiales bacterium COT073_COT-073]|nr:tRNA pseudouridine(55) synthase TruB [Clostridiales bacterium COT073_COT-073]
MNGILNIYKEQGYTSHDVVAILRRILKTKRIGHTGTLDPNAEGVLPICIGQATKISELLMEKQKTYVAALCLGKSTDTQDIWGKVVSQSEVLVSPAEVQTAILSFQGQIMQIPPMYSAIKQDGKKLYELARQGKEVQRQPRPATIYAISDLEQIGKAEYRFSVTCSKGTYIRTLCHDIGQKLGCGAHMTALQRTRSGKFGLETALKLAEVEKLKADGKLAEHLLPITEVFDIPELTVKDSFSKWLYAGNPIPLEQIQAGDLSKIVQLTEISRMDRQLPTHDLYYIYDSHGRFIGIYRYINHMLKVLKFLYQASEE